MKLVGVRNTEPVVENFVGIEEVINDDAVVWVKSWTTTCCVEIFQIPEALNKNVKEGNIEVFEEDEMCPGGEYCSKSF